MFETLVEDSPEEESTLTSKLSGRAACMCVREELLGCVLGRRAGLAFGLEDGVTAVALVSFGAFFLPELGNTISSLFGGGATADTKENGTDTVQVRPHGARGTRRVGYGPGEWQRTQGLGWAFQLPGIG